MARGYGKSIIKTRALEKNRKEQNLIIHGEVLDIVVNKDHENYKDSGYIGDAKIKIYGPPQEYNSGPDRGYKWIKLLRRDIQTLPLIGELVVAIKAPSLAAQDNPQEMMYYFLSSVCAWGERNENSVPNASFNSKAYYENDVLGDTFKEKTVFPLHPYEGDTIIQSRWDSSIRLGSTISGGKTTDTWSIGSDAGDPIMIFTNEFASEGSDKIEDINKDRSTIMMTSKQKIDIELPNPESPQTVTIPTGPVIPMQPLNTFVKKPQIIISSDRLIFNAKNDNVLISAKKDISLSTAKWKVNVTALADILRETLNQLTMEVHPTPCGPTGTPINAPIYSQLLIQLESMLQ